jgi:hypothetical protein
MVGCLKPDYGCDTGTDLEAFMLPLSSMYPEVAMELVRSSESKNKHRYIRYTTQNYKMNIGKQLNET